MSNASPAEQVGRFAAWLAGTDIAELEFRTPRGEVFLIRRDVAAAGSTAPEIDEPASETASGTAITAASVGIFLRRHPSRDTPAARAGQTVRAGDGATLVRLLPG
jgi:biotin carboxyl carrier protein